MAKQSRSGSIRLRARQVKGAVRLLRSLGIPVGRIAAAFDETPENIRQVDNRAYQEKTRDVQAPSPISALITSYNEDGDDWALLRSKNQNTERIRDKRHLEETLALIEELRRTHASTGFQEAIRRLEALRPKFANARSGSALHIRNILYENLAWFLARDGQAQAALQHAETAMQLAREAYDQSLGDTSHLLRYGEAALIAGVSCCALHLPASVFPYIDEERVANLATSKKSGSEHHRQRGTALLSMGAKFDADAIKSFRKAALRMEQKQEVRHALDLSMSSERQRYFLLPKAGWERARELSQQVATVFGSDSLEHVLAANWSAATGLKLNDPHVTATVLGDLEALEPHLPRNNRQCYVWQLLRMTPQFGLVGEVLDTWLRYVLNVSVPSSK